ncbi:hypothetical protein SNN53_000849 [Cronobacter sakazakii]|uniref:hypothetical protein n=1 Tax=Cronobacter sakazakii TaxID=28141 RepID=UPI000CF11A17|nr:hypothetical protein [Cronobacter sakazakii]EJQ2005343.1 hypothetical protein [Cronobacter sakazakii]EJQ2086457.1 hypothetical protein [Cronobacter sakazakii]EJR9310129.1 hypothetical protein [Cronobacter sakazakii]EJR9314757.1 hypothetical protein [Cronobacter sakazakii]EJR9321846.1 hypothetical protein [Cronobacter sakazakii]
MLNQAVTRFLCTFFHSREQQHIGSNSLLLRYGRTIKVNLLDAYFLVSYIYSLKSKRLYCEEIFSTDLEMHIDPHSDPKAWESFFKSIIWLHYKPANCCDLPDSHGGDFGLECYTLDGHVFQCYLPAQSSDINKLYKAQQKKIYNDIQKFSKDNVKELEELFGTLKISRWILATPYNKSAKLSQYCTKKSLKVRELGLPYVADDFQIIVQTEESYSQEAFLLRRDSYQLSLNLDDTTVDGAMKFISSNSSFLEKLNLKLPKLHDSVSRQEQMRNFLIQKFLDYQNLLDTLKQNWVDIYEVVYKCIQQRESNLVGIFMLSPSNAQPSGIMKDQIETLKKCIEEEVPTFKQADLEKITWGVISDWLIRCPLDF